MLGRTPTGVASAARQSGSQPASAGRDPSRYAGALSPGFHAASRMEIELLGPRVEIEMTGACVAGARMARGVESSIIA